MKIKLLLATLATLTVTSVQAWDKEIPTECVGKYEIAVKAKGTPLEEKTFSEFLECTGEFKREDIKKMAKQSLCYSFKLDFIGENDYSCLSPKKLRKRG